MSEKRDLKEIEKLEGIGKIDDSELIGDEGFEVEEEDEERIVGLAADEENEEDDDALIEAYKKAKEENGIESDETK